MERKAFPCRIEELPVIGEFLVENLQHDMDDFSAFSPIFTAAFADSISSQIEECKDMVNSVVYTKDLKVTTATLKADMKDLRLQLNSLEGYLTLADGSTDMPLKEMGFKAIRNASFRGNVEGTLQQLRTLLTIVDRNKPALTAQGMTQGFRDDIEKRYESIRRLNNKQNDLMRRRGRQTKSNVEAFNALWFNLQRIIKTGQALYRGRDAVRLKDYTMSTLRKRVNAEGKLKR